MRAALLSLLCLLSLPTLAAPKVPELKPVLEDFQLPTRDMCFPSGLRVVFQSDPSSPTVSVLSLIDGGSSLDPAGQEGAAHLLEHLWFRAKPQGGATIQARLEAMGASFNAATGPDYTAYSALVPKAQLPMAVRLETLRLEDPLVGVTEADVATERRIIQNERDQSNLSRAVLDALRGSLFPKGHPYSRGLGETPESVSRLDLAAARASVSRSYRPENTTLIIVGDVDLAGADAILNQAVPDAVFYGPGGAQGTPKTCAPRMNGAPAEPPPPASTGLVTLRSNVPRPQAFVAWSLPAAVSNDLVQEELLAEAASAWLNFRLWSATRTQTAEDGGASCRAEGGHQGAVLQCGWTLRAGQDAASAISRAVDEIDRMWDREFRSSLTEIMEGSRRDAGLDTLLLLERSPELLAGRPMALAEAVHLLGTPAFLGARMAALDAVTPTDLVTLGGRYITGARAARLAVVPTNASALWAARATGSEAPAAAPRASAAEAPSAHDLKALVVGADLSKMREAKLGNGMRVVVVPAGAAPLVQSWLWFPDAGDPATPGLNTLARASLDLFPEVQRLGPALLEMPRYLLSGWSLWSLMGGSVLGDRGPSGDLEQHLYMLSEMVTDMAFNAASRRSALDRLGQAADARGRSPLWREAQLSEALVAPGHTNPELLTRGDVDRLSALAPGAVESRIKAVFQPSNATLFIVGKVSPDAAVKQAEAWLGRWKATAAPLPAPAPAAAPGDRVVLLLDSPGDQTLVTLRCPGAPATAESTEARQVLVESWRRIANQTLREQLGSSYGVEAWEQARTPDSTLLTLQAVVESGRAVEATQLMLSLPAKTQSRSLPADQVSAATVTLAGATALRHVNNQSLGAWLLDTTRLGHPWTAITGTGARLAAVDSARLAAEASRCVNHEVLSLVGPADALEPPLKAAGLSVHRP